LAAWADPTARLVMIHTCMFSLVMGVRTRNVRLKISFTCPTYTQFLTRAGET
jgi:hypothetical protein